MRSIGVCVRRSAWGACLGATVVAAPPACGSGLPAVCDEWAHCMKSDGTVCVAMNVGASSDVEQARDDFVAACQDGSDGDVGTPAAGKCPSSSARGACKSTCAPASGPLESTGEVVGLELAWYTDDPNNADVCRYQVSGVPASCPASSGDPCSEGSSGSGGSTGGGKTIPVIGDAEWRAAPSSEVDPSWMLSSFDASSWLSPTLPAPNACGATVGPDLLGRPLEPWEQSGVLTMWSTSSAATAYMRRVIDLPANAVVASAKITTLSDDDHDLYVNGVQVVSDHDSLAGPVISTDIASHLVPGRNVIAVVASDAACCCRWMVVNGSITLQ